MSEIFSGLLIGVIVGAVVLLIWFVGDYFRSS